MRTWTSPSAQQRGFVFWGGFFASSLTGSPVLPQDIAAYRQKTKGGPGSASKPPAKVEKKANDDDDDDDEDEEDDDDDDE